jgi:hypothetical protein
MRPDLPQPVGVRPATNGKGGPGRFFDAQGKPTDDPELGYYGRAARAPLDAAYQAATEKQPDAVADVPHQVETQPPASPDIDHQRHSHEALMTHVAEVIEEQLRNLDEAKKAKREAAAEEKQLVEPPAQLDQPVSAPDPVPARPMLPGDRQREAIRARNQEALRRAEAEMKRRAGLQ